MSYVTGISGNVISAASAAYAPTNGADVSAIASAYQVVSATATQLNAGTAYLTSVNDAPISAARAGNAANASMANSAYYDGTGRFISALPDSATVSAIASSYAESAASSKQDTLTFGYDADNKISSIDGSALAGGEGGGLVTSIQTAQDPWYQQSISGLNGSSIYPKWAANASYAESAAYASQAASAASAAAAPTAWAASFISSVSSPSGTIRVLNNNEIEGTNSAVLPSTVVEGFSVVSSVQYSTTAFSFTVPTSNPNTQVIITGGWAYGNFGISGDNGVTAESSLDGYVNVTFDMPGATAFDVTSEAWVEGIGYTASALASEVGGGIGELAWASALPTYQYDAEDKISSINGSALAGGGAGGVDSSTCSAIASAYAESAASSKLDTTAFNSGDFYTTANESGYVDSTYVDSAVSGKAESSALSSYALSADVSGTVDLVSTQSANWGGSALALSAGPGVKLEKVGDTLVASTDETVLWSGELSEAGTVTAAESLADFEKIELHWHTASGSYPIIDSVHINDNTPAVCFVHGAGASNAWIQWCMCSASANTFTVVRGKSLNFGAYNSTAATYTVFTSLGDSFQLNKIVGINRTAGV